VVPVASSHVINALRALRWHAKRRTTNKQRTTLRCVVLRCVAFALHVRVRVRLRLRLRLRLRCVALRLRLRCEFCECAVCVVLCGVVCRVCVCFLER